MSTAGYGAATSIIGGELQGWAALLDKWKMEQEFDSELKRQNAFKQEALNRFGQRIPTAGSDQAYADLSSGAADRNARYAAVQQVPMGIASKGQPQGNPQRDAATASLLGQQRAALGAYSDWGLKQAIQNIQTQRALNQIEDRAKGQAGVFPYRMYDAQHSHDVMAEVGQAISSLGGGSSDYSKFAGGDPSGGGMGYSPAAYSAYGQAYGIDPGQAQVGGNYMNNNTGYIPEA